MSSRTMRLLSGLFWAAALIISSSAFGWIGIPPQLPQYATQGGSQKGRLNRPADTAAIQRVTVYWRALDMLVSGRTMRCVIKCEGSTKAYGPTEVVPGVWTSYQATWNTNPETSAPWQKTDLDGLTIGGQYTDRTGGNYVRITQIYLSYYLSGVTTTLRPNADSVDGTWTDDTGATTLWDHIEEAVADDGTSYVHTWTQNDEFFVAIQDPT